MLLCWISSPALAQTAVDQAVDTNNSVVQQYEQQRFEQQLGQSIQREQDALHNDLSVNKSNLEPQGPVSYTHLTLPTKA